MWPLLILLIVLGIYIFAGLHRGFITSVVDLVETIASFFVAFALYELVGDVAAESMNASPLIARPVAFVALFGVTLLVAGGIARHILRPLTKHVRRTSRADSVLAIVPSFLQGLIIGVFVLTALLAAATLIPGQIGTPNDSRATAIREGLAGDGPASSMVQRGEGLENANRGILVDLILGIKSGQNSAQADSANQSASDDNADQ